MITLSFFGAAGEVTGSCYLVHTDQARVLVDFGLHQGEKEAEEHNRRLPPIRPSDLDAVVLTHGHLDHCGRLPLLIRGGFRGKIYCTAPTTGIASLILRDSAHLQQQDAEQDNRRRARRGEPPVDALYGIDDVERILPMLTGMAYGQDQAIAPGVTIRFSDAGHILGSSSVLMNVEEKRPGGVSVRRTISFSGDIGVKGSPILRDPTPTPPADVVVMESTYGDRDHKALGPTLDEMLQILREAQRDGGRVVIPSFALGRTQDLIYHFGNFLREGKLTRLSVYVDSPMAVAASDLYRKHTEMYDASSRELLRTGVGPLSFPGLHYTKTPDESRRLNDTSGSFVIISAAGMCTGGRILHHLRHSLWRPETRIVIVGYQAGGTLGRQLVDGAKTVRIYGEPVAVKARVHTLGGFSAHAGQTELIEWVRPLAGLADKPRVILTHGEDGPRRALAEKLRALGLTCELPMYGDVVELG